MVVTRQQPSCHMGQAVSNPKMLQGCHKLAQTCVHNLVTKLWQGCNNLIQHSCYKEVCFVWLWTISHIVFFFNTEEKLRSILAEMDYTRTVQKLDDQGVPLRSYIYVPEVHSITNTIFHEKEDEGDVLKVNSN